MFAPIRLNRFYILRLGKQDVVKRGIVYHRESQFDGIGRDSVEQVHSVDYTAVRCCFHTLYDVTLCIEEERTVNS